MGKRLRVSPYRRPYAETPERPGAYVTICDQINTAGRPGKTPVRDPRFARPPPPGKPGRPGGTHYRAPPRAAAPRPGRTRTMPPAASPPARARTPEPAASPPRTAQY